MQAVREFSEAAKYDWPVARGDLVVDVGAYEGNWTREMVKRYECQVWAFEPVFFDRAKADQSPLVTVFPAALGHEPDVQKWCVKGDMTGKYLGEGNHTQSVTVLPVSVLYAWSRIKVLKLNCEGGEYDILNQLICDDKIKLFDHFLIQWHHVVGAKAFEPMHDLIRSHMAKTHALLFDAPWCWEGWGRK